MRLLVIGGSGLLGSNFSIISSNNNEVISTYSKNQIQLNGCSCIKLDATNLSDLTNVIKKVKPETIVNCAGLTNVDYCETHKDEAHNLNVKIPQNLVLSQKDSSFKIVHISTDSVFDGKKGNYTEDDLTTPLNVYSKTKLDGEKVVLNSNNYLILRTNLFGWNFLEKLSLAEWFIEKLSKKQKTSGFSDVFFNPLTVNTLTEIILKLLNTKASGLYHLGSTKISKYEFGTKIAELFNLDKTNIAPSSIDDISTIAKRPKNTTLKTQKISKLINMPSIEDELKLFYKLKNNGYYERLKGNS
ncbi:MAG: SDR family oxidoreductase [archaeon]